MTWTPPPESERAHYYKCLGLIAIQAPDFVWTECIWDEDDHVWYSDLNDCADVEPVAFAPLPDEAAARIEELEAYVAQIEKAAQDAVEALRSTGSSWPIAAGKALKAALSSGKGTP